jgi:tetratricopeptide (TPR) repeat protein
VDRGLPALPDLKGGDPAIIEQMTALSKEATAQPDNDELVGRLGMLYHAYGLNTEADQVYVHLRVRQPEVVRWAYLHGHALMAQKKLPEAAAAFRRALELRPDYIPASIALVSALAQMREFGAGIEILVPLQDKYPKDPMIGYRLGILYLEVNEPIWAVQFLKPIHQQNPAWGGVRRALAESFRRLGQPDRAAELGNADNRDVPTLHDPELIAIYAETTGAIAEERRALAFLSQGDYAASVEHFEKALRFNPESTTARAGRIDALMNSAQFDRAEELMKADLAARPDDVTMLMSLADLYLLRERFSDAEAAIAKVRETPVERSMVKGLEVRLALGRQDFAKAAEMLEPMAKADPDNPEIWQQLGEAYLGLGKHTEAEKALQRALQIAPAFGNAMDALGDVYAARNEGGAALTWYRKAAAAGALLSPAKCMRVVTTTLEMADYATGARVLQDCSAAYPQDKDLADTVIRLYAMCPDPKYRNGAEAVRRARELYGESQGTMSVRGLSTTAAAYAEVNDWAKAQELTRAAIAKATAEKDVQMISRLSQLLAAYNQERHSYADDWSD